MSEASYRLPRLEGAVELTRADDGALRLTGPPSQFFERKLVGRGALDSVFLTQQISADSGVSHALAAVGAWETAAGLSVAETGRALRQFLLAASLLHAHVRQFYQQALPDYLPPASLTAYAGDYPELVRLREAVKAKSAKDWQRYGYDQPFNAAEQAQLWEHVIVAQRTLVVLQRMMAVIGGKYPVAMSVVPGGVSLRLDAGTVLKLRSYLGRVREFLAESLPADAALVIKRYPALKTAGRGREDLLCVGTGEDDSAFETSLFPSGVLLAGKLERFTAVTVESIRHAYYRLPSEAPANGGLVVAAPDKPEAHSWIKAPRYSGRALETGPLSRLVIAYLSGARLHDPKLVDVIEKTLGVPLVKANTVAGRMLARAGEAGALVERCETLLEQMYPAQPTVQSEGDPSRSSGEGTGYVEAPAGALQHRVVLEKGKIVSYDIISPSTWNGSPQDDAGEAGSLETALNRERTNPAEPAHRRALSRIIQSFAFSMSDATH